MAGGRIGSHVDVRRQLRRRGGGHGKGLSVFHRAGESDRWQRVQLLTDVADPSFVIVDRQRRCVYSRTATARR